MIQWVMSPVAATEEIAVPGKNIAANNLDERLHMFVCFLDSFFAVIHETLIQMIGDLPMELWWRGKA